MSRCSAPRGLSSPIHVRLNTCTRGGTILRALVQTVASRLPVARSSPEGYYNRVRQNGFDSFTSIYP